MDINLKGYSTVIFIYIFVSFVFGNGTIPAMAAKVLLFMSMVLLFATTRKKLSNIIFIVWGGLFAGFCFLSKGWTVSPNDTNPMTITVLLSVICNSSFYYILSINKISLKQLFNWIIFASIFATIVYVLQNGFSFVGEAGRDLEHSGRNLNSIGYQCAVGAIACYYNYTKNKNAKFIWFAIYLLFFILLSGSRTALAFPLIFMGVYYVVSSPHVVSKLFIVSIVVVLLLFLVIKVDFLYNLIGYRVETLIWGVVGEDSMGDTDASTASRLKFIELGMEFFKESPWLGFGLSTFGFISGFETYAHNNYVELLVGVGLIGCILYYSIHLIMLKRYYTISKKYPWCHAPFFLGLLVATLIANYGNVSYFSLADNIMLSIMAVFIFERSEETLTPVKMIGKKK